ncbi:MAG TPA: serine hydrolase [Pyrinomonadaceae bacterium]|nr:serine hydrolase [Pyrinomonadaceae bacterium]
MRLAAFGILLVCLFVGRGVSGQSGVPELQREIPRLMSEGEVPGLQIALIRGGKVTWIKSFGVKNAETREPVTDSTIFEAASLSKPVFAYAVMKLVEAGRLDLDRPLQSYLSEPYIKDDDRINLITARMALNHTTGFQNESRPGQPLKINFTPGEKFSYSGEGLLFLQRVLEKITGEKLDAFMRRTVFEPLGMTSSSYVWQDRYEGLKASGHRIDSVPQPIRKPTVAFGYASLQTTAGDYAKFVAALLNGVGLKKATFDEIWRTQVRVDETCVNCIGRPEGRPSESLSWGLGWGLEQTSRGRAVWHWGDNNSQYHAFVMLYPKDKTGLVVFTNSGNGHSIIPEIVGRVFGNDIVHPAFAWMGYDSYKSPPLVFYRDVLARGLPAVAEYRTSRKPALSEAQVNAIGYRLLAKKRNQEAIEMFKINVEDYPKSANVYDSLGEAFMINGDRDLAIKNLQQSLALDPKNTHAAELLKKLGEK